jgi:hypothetical protein
MFKFQLLAFLLSFASLAVCQKSTYNFKFDEGKYSINFPAAPKEQRQIVPIEDMGDIEMVAMMYEPSQNKVFMVAHADYPEAMVEAAKKADKKAVSSIIDNAKQGAVSQMKLTISKEKKITLQGYRGISFMADNGDIYTEYQIFLVGNRLYQMAILSQGKAISKADAKPFFGSFKFIK